MCYLPGRWLYTPAQKFSCRLGHLLTISSHFPLFAEVDRTENSKCLIMGWSFWRPVPTRSHPGAYPESPDQNQDALSALVTEDFTGVLRALCQALGTGIECIFPITNKNITLSTASLTPCLVGSPNYYEVPVTWDCGPEITVP